MATQSSWERRVDDSGSVVFDVSPARGSITFLVLYAFGLVFATVFFGVIGLVVLLVAECVRVTKPDQPTPWHKVSDIPAYVLLGAVLGAGLQTVGWWFRDGRHMLRSHTYRRPVTITVNKQGLASRGRLYPLQDVGELAIHAWLQSTKDFKFGGDDVVIVGGGAVGALAAATTQTQRAVARAVYSGVASLRQRHIDRSLILVLRTRQSSQWHVIAGGLTRDCADSLVNGLLDALRKARG